MKRPLRPRELAELQRLLRVRICAGCPQARPAKAPRDAETPRVCEGACPVFVHLPMLLAYAENLDPMIGSFDRVIDSLAGQCAPCRANNLPADKHQHDCPLALHRHELAGVLREEARRLRREPSGDALIHDAPGKAER